MTQIITTSTTGPGANIFVLADEFVYIAENVTRASTDNYALVALNGGAQIHVLGNLVGTVGMHLDDVVDAIGGFHVTIESTGSVVGVGSGLELDDSDNTVINNGEITGLNLDGITSLGDNFFLSNNGIIAGHEGNGINSSGSDFRINNTGIITSQQSNGVLSAGVGTIITNSGTINSSVSDGIRIFGFVTINNTGNIIGMNDGADLRGGNATLTNSGTIIATGDSAIEIDTGNNIIYNDGEIRGTENGIITEGGGAQISNNGLITASDGWAIWATGATNVIRNGGDLAATRDGIYAEAGTGNLIINSGTVATSSSSSTNAAVNMASVAGEATRLVNSGELIGPRNAVLGGDGVETVVNRGAIDGDVDLGGGNDLFKGRGGSVDGDIRGRTGNDTLIGGVSDDAIFGDFGNDGLRGGDGDDTLTGGTGRDVMTGGLGSDSFDFNKASETAVGGERDSIADFSQGEDVIDVSGIDADTGLGGNQAFAFIGGDPFSGSAGELRVTATASGNTIVAGDTDGDGSADFQILVQGVTGLAAADFLL